MKHLWEIDHPFYGADGYRVDCESFAGLREYADAYPAAMNHIYRWDWDSYEDGDRLTVYVVMPRKEQFTSWYCPVTRDQEAEVLEWLRGPRVLGALRELWEPLLDEPAATGGASDG